MSLTTGFFRWFFIKCFSYDKTGMIVDNSLINRLVIISSKNHLL